MDVTYRCERGQFLPDPAGDWIRIEHVVPHGTALVPGTGMDGHTIIVWTLKDDARN